jgi:hypothetical protein
MSTPPRLRRAHPKKRGTSRRRGDGGPVDLVSTSPPLAQVLPASRLCAAAGLFDAILARFLHAEGLGSPHASASVPSSRPSSMCATCRAARGLCCFSPYRRSLIPCSPRAASSGCRGVISGRPAKAVAGFDLPARRGPQRLLSGMPLSPGYQDHPPSIPAHLLGILHGAVGRPCSRPGTGSTPTGQDHRQST